MGDVFWSGLVAMGFTYAAIFVVGLLASRGRPKPADGESGLAEMMLAGRSMPLWVALLTMTATWVGGGYINGTAEVTFTSGAFYGAQAGLGFGLSLVVGGLFFARVMRRHGFATLVDPLERRYGRWPAAALMVPAVLAEVIWSGAILVALGTTFGAVVGLDQTTAILVSASIAIVYTVAGGLRSVAYTDVVQLALIVIGLGVAAPFVVSSAGGWSALVSAPGTSGSVEAFPAMSLPEGAIWGDWLLLFVLGGIPWNVYFQRVLASRDETTASQLSLLAAVLCVLLAVPPLVMGLGARLVDWNAVAGPEVAAALGDSASNVLPYLLRYAVPHWVSVIGLGAVSAAVMSSVDSSILSASSLVAWNGYRRLIDPDASAARIAWLIRILVVLLGSVATVLALTVSSVAALWYLCGDVVYCVLFPQLALALFDKRANAAGAMAGLAVATFLRLGGGVSELWIPAFLPYPSLGDDLGFPFRTLAMLAGLITALGVSRLTVRMSPPRPLAA